MTVYVDDYRVRARVGRTSGRWSHLTANADPDELHAFAARLGIVRAWYQESCKTRCAPIGTPCPHWHYDVVDRVRTEALALGAVGITYRQMGELCRARRNGQTWTPPPLAVVETITIDPQPGAQATLWTGPPACRICGCTDDNACPGGCWWVTDPNDPRPLCSTCRPGLLD